MDNSAILNSVHSINTGGRNANTLSRQTRSKEHASSSGTLGREGRRGQGEGRPVARLRTGPCDMIGTGGGRGRVSSLCLEQGRR